MNALTDVYKKEEIINSLNQTFHEVSQMTVVLTDEEFYRKPNEKWSVAENLDHLIRSTKGLGSALKMPKLALRASFGKANRPSRTFPALIDRYKERLQKGAVASGAYVPEDSTKVPKAQYLENWQGIGEKFKDRLGSEWTEEQLDKLVIPHPLLGKLTVREMMFFTIYHNLHHLKNMKNLYASFV